MIVILKCIRGSKKKGGRILQRTNERTMAASMCCCLPITCEENSAILPISDKSLRKIKECIEEWRYLDGAEREVAEKFTVSSKQLDNFDAFGYHSKCYKRFTDKTKIERAKKRCAKLNNSTPGALRALTPPPRKSSLVSYTENAGCMDSGTQLSRGSMSISPDQCVICKGERYIKDSHTRTRRLEKLSLCEQPTGEC